MPYSCVFWQKQCSSGPVSKHHRQTPVLWIFLRPAAPRASLPRPRRSGGRQSTRKRRGAGAVPVGKGTADTARVARRTPQRREGTQRRPHGQPSPHGTRLQHFPRGRKMHFGFHFFFLHLSVAGVPRYIGIGRAGQGLGIYPPCWRPEQRRILPSATAWWPWRAPCRAGRGVPTGACMPLARWAPLGVPLRPFHGLILEQRVYF